MHNVIVLGGSYGGSHAARILANGLGGKYRVILIDRNSHANHLYVIPRLSVIPGHEHKAFIPYSRVFSDRSSNVDATSPPNTPNRHLVLHATITSLNAQSVIVDRAFPEHGLTNEIPYKYAVYALGSHMPAPIDLWSEKFLVTNDLRSAKLENTKIDRKVEKYRGTKREGIDWLKRYQQRIRDADSVLVVGGGALGVQFATDIASCYPDKRVTLLHSRHRLLPRFGYELHLEIINALEELRVNVILGERLDLATLRHNAACIDDHGRRVVRTLKGRELVTDLLLMCTGQVPNTELIGELSPKSVDPETKLAYVLPTMQLAIPSSERPVEEVSCMTAAVYLDKEPEPGPEVRSQSTAVLTEKEEVYPEEVEEEEGLLRATPFPHIFVIGDAADAFGAIKAGHTAYHQAGVAARNVIQLAKYEEERVETVESSAQEPVLAPPVLEQYYPGEPAIKISLGLGCKAAYEIGGRIGRKDEMDGDDLDAKSMWTYMGISDVTEEGMFV